jgi:hypothetical protein
MEDGQGNSNVIKFPTMFKGENMSSMDRLIYHITKAQELSIDISEGLDPDEPMDDFVSLCQSLKIALWFAEHIDEDSQPVP